MRTAKEELLEANNAIEREIKAATIGDRASCLQNMFRYLRNLIEHLLVYRFFGPESCDDYSHIEDAVKQAGQVKDTRFIKRLHARLQPIVSHYTPSAESSDYILANLYEDLFAIKDYASKELRIDLLSNLDQLTIEADAELNGYYQAAARAVDNVASYQLIPSNNQHYYVCKMRPFIANSKVYYEITLAEAFDNASKRTNFIAFSATRIPENNAITVVFRFVRMRHGSIVIPTFVIEEWKTAILPNELNLLMKILGAETRIQKRHRCYERLMSLLDAEDISLDELVSFDDATFSKILNKYYEKGSDVLKDSLLLPAHRHITKGLSGSNVLHYLLSNPRHRVIQSQFDSNPNTLLGGLRLSWGSIPFDNLPFSFSLVGHTPATRSIPPSIDAASRKDELYAKKIAVYSIDNSTVYVPEEAIETEDDVDGIIAEYNAKLYYKHNHSALIHDRNHIYVEENETVLIEILKTLLRMSKKGVSGYKASFQRWNKSHPGILTNPDHINILESLFDKTHIALICGSAGTGKTTLLGKLVSSLPNVSFAAIANTNAAVGNLDRKINARNCECMTATSFIANPRNVTVLLIDECSTLSNKAMLDVLRSKTFKALVLVGDTCQIEAIELGNWFETVQPFLPSSCVHEIMEPYRTCDTLLLELWKAVRNSSDNIGELLVANDVSHDLDDDFLIRGDDEIVLCLSYGGLYGINNINRLLQASREGRELLWGLQHYKKGDPVLFNDSRRFHPLIYNNMKGSIFDLRKIGDDAIRFDIALDATITELDINPYPDLELVGNDEEGKSIVRFTVSNDPNSTNGDTSGNDNPSVIPFDIAYAISIHKAQGLEYDSVKIVVSDDTESLVTKNIFYTAITRARKHLKVYWTPQTQHDVLSRITEKRKKDDIGLIRVKLNVD